MSLLTMIQDVCDSVGITRPNAVITSTDQNVLTLVALSNTSGNALMKRYQWQELTNFSGTIAASGGLAIGTIAALFPNGYDRMVNQTFWNNTQRQPVTGPPTLQSWQTSLASNVAGPPYQFIIINSILYVGPTAVAATDYFTAYYISKYWNLSAAGAGQTKWAADDDESVIPEELFKLDLIWRWKSKNGLSYAEDLETAENAIETYTGGNTPSRVLFLGGQNVGYTANIPEGYWPG